MAKQLTRSLRFFVSLLIVAILSTTKWAAGQTISVYTSFPEDFESGSKTAYTYGSVTLSTGTWAFDDALIGTSAADRKHGGGAARLRNSGKLTMLFDISSGVSKINIFHGAFGTDTACTWGLWYSTNSGITWSQAAANITSSTTGIAQTTFSMSLYGNVRFEIRKLSGSGRLNIDDITIEDNSGVCCCGCTSSASSDTTATEDDNLAMGNPGAAGSGTIDSNNFLIVKHQYALSYNNSKGEANWVSWHLSTAWKGDAERCDCFTQDLAIPSGYFRAVTSDYTGTGFDRGHMCPSDDRDLNDSDNAATFKMSNIMPQAPNLNQVTWANLETYCRQLITHGNELYIIAGAYGSGGSGSLGGTTTTIASGDIRVPAHYWKVIVVLPVGINDVSRVDTSTRIIAVDMPNIQTVSENPWGYYRTTVDSIEAVTGLDIMSEVSGAVQTVIEATTDTGPTSY